MDTKLDLTFAQIVAAQMDDYVHAETLFYPVGAKNVVEMQPLTIGNWLETEWRLSVLAPNDPALAAARTAVGKVLTTAPELYQNKARREFKSRLDTWELWLEEQRATRTQGDTRAFNTVTAYGSQAHVRLKLELLQANVAQPPAQLARLLLADDTLRRHFRSGRFMWEPALAAVAPTVKWWWLYGA